MMDSLAIKFELEASDDVEFRTRLVSKINELILNDFNRLVQILYLVDVDESKLRGLLQKNSSIDAGEILADLLIEREKAKIASRAHPGSDQDIAENDKW